MVDTEISKDRILQVISTSNKEKEEQGTEGQVSFFRFSFLGRLRVEGTLFSLRGAWRLGGVLLGRPTIFHRPDCLNDPPQVRGSG